MSSENNNFYLNIGIRLKEKREEKGYSYAELANLTGISKSSLQRYETGNTKKIPMEAISKLEDALCIPKGYLMGWTTQPEKPDEEDFLANSGLVVQKPVQRAISALREYTPGKAYGFAERPRESYSRAPRPLRSDFAFVAPDDSMLKARIKQGDTVYIDKYRHAENGEIELISVKGTLMLRHAYYAAGYWTFASADVYDAPLLSFDPKKDEIALLGKAVALYSPL